MRLSILLDALPDKVVTGHTDFSVRSVVHDSRIVQPGDLFVAIREPSGNDGHRYIPSAVEQGAVAIVREQTNQLTHLSSASVVTTVLVPDSNRALAILADCQYRHPSQDLTLIGVTGTNGKTTVTFLIESILRAHGAHTGVIGTAENRFDTEPLPGPQTHTTPYPAQLQALLRMIADRDGRYAVLEVSSHALVLDRVAPLAFQVGIFTNLTRDHLDYHKTFEAYRDAKLRLFRDYLHRDGTAVINCDDPSSERFLAATTGKTLTCSLDGSADIMLDGPVEMTSGGSILPVRTPTGVWHISLPLLGRYNMSNALVAIGGALALDIPPSAITTGLQNVSIPGRLERIECGQPFMVVVDYAHTPDALRAALTAVREWTAGRLFVVFGCGGDRDRGKRPQMGDVASMLADVVVITSDNPRTEPPQTIITEIESGIRLHAAYASIIDRREAITDALAQAREGDTVVIAGKGHETYQEIGTTRIPFDDRNVAREVLCEHVG